MNKIALEVRVARGREFRAMRWGSDEKVQGQWQGGRVEYTGRTPQQKVRKSKVEVIAVGEHGKRNCC